MRPKAPIRCRMPPLRPTKMATTPIQGGAGKNASMWWKCHTAPAPSPQKYGDGRSIQIWIDSRYGDDDHAFTFGGLSRWAYHSSGAKQRSVTTFTSGLKRAKNTPADCTVYPHVYPFKTQDHK